MNGSGRKQTTLVVLLESLGMACGCSMLRISYVSVDSSTYIMDCKALRLGQPSWGASIGANFLINVIYALQEGEKRPL